MFTSMTPQQDSLQDSQRLPLMAGDHCSEIAEEAICLTQSYSQCNVSGGMFRAWRSLLCLDSAGQCHGWLNIPMRAWQKGVAGFRVASCQSCKVAGLTNIAPTLATTNGRWVA